jgi:hypothetical protein
MLTVVALQETQAGRVLEEEVVMSPVGGVGEVKKVHPHSESVVIKKEE